MRYCETQATFVMALNMGYIAQSSWRGYFRVVLTALEARTTAEGQGRLSFHKRQHIACLQPFNEGEEEGNEAQPEGEERMEILQEQAQPSDRPRITTRYMTKYERARILGTRALQIR